MLESTLTTITNSLIAMESVLPLPIFVIVGSIVEEIISPIPATLVLGLVGSYFAATDGSIPYFILLIILATGGKTLAAWATYWLGRLFGEFVIKKWGKLFGINISDIEATNVKLKTKNTWGIVFAMRALPIAPSAAVSIAAGILHLRQRMFIASTFAGYIIRNALTALAGYAGINIFASWEKYSNNPVYGIIAIIALVGLAIYLLIKGYRRYYNIT